MKKYKVFLPERPVTETNNGDLSMKITENKKLVMMEFAEDKFENLKTQCPASSLKEIFEDKSSDAIDNVMSEETVRDMITSGSIAEYYAFDSSV